MQVYCKQCGKLMDSSELYVLPSGSFCMCDDIEESVCFECGIKYNIKQSFNKQRK